MKVSLYEFIEQTYNNLLNLHIGLDEKEYKIRGLIFIQIICLDQSM